MKYRIAMWASAGFFVSACWAIYFGMRNKDNPIEPIVQTLALVTQPFVLVIHGPISFYSVMLANAATYALIGLAVETLRRQLSHAK